MPRQCTACSRRPAATTPEWPALCQSCLDRCGEQIEPGVRVVCEVDESCNGTVSRLEDGLAIVTTTDGGEAWLPIPELVAVIDR